MLGSGPGRLASALSDYPFLNPEFLAALEETGCTTAATGWDPQHLAAGDGTPYMPLYVKTHSYGEYVFDWAWANAYQRYGLAYYPKLVTAIPFSPITGPRLRPPAECWPAATAEALFAEVRQKAAACRASSWHLLFPDTATRTLFRDLDLLEREGVQFHWFNRGYRDFDDYLGALNARKRKMIKRERRRIAEQGLQVETLPGHAVDADLWSFFFRLYQNTYVKRSGTAGYLTAAFFHRIGSTLANQLALTVARDGGRPVAAALYFHDANHLYGRYWGCVREYEHLHFELCCYQGIEFAIRRGLARFDAGAQGEHKIPRGFEPVPTWSLHWIRDRQFAVAIADFLAREKAYNRRYLEQAQALLPFRQDGG